MLRQDKDALFDANAGDNWRGCFQINIAGLARLRGPIGIYIGSKTPPEIAVSIMAEILAVKNGVALPRDMDVAHAKNDLAIIANDPGLLVCGVPAAP